MELEQGSGLVRRSFTLVAEGIRTRESSLSGGKTVTIPYEVIFGDSFEVWTASRRALIAAVVMAGLSIVTMVVADTDRFAWLFWGVAACLAGGYYLFTRHDQFGFTDGSNRILFFRDRPSGAAIEAFLEEVQKRARARVRDKVWPLRSSGDARTDRDRAQVLRDKGIISAQEYAELERELNGAPARERLEN